MFITQPSCLLDFHLTESVRRKSFVLVVYQFWKGISAGPALKYFTWFIGAGGWGRCVCLTYEWVMSHIWMSHTRQRVMSHIWMSHATLSIRQLVTWVECFICRRDMTPSTCVPWLIHMCGMPHWFGWHDSFICVMWLIHMCDMTHQFVWHDTSICVTWLIHMRGMTHWYVWHELFMCVIWPIPSHLTNKNDECGCSFDIYKWLMLPASVMRPNV